MRYLQQGDGPKQRRSNTQVMGREKKGGAQEYRISAKGLEPGPGKRDIEFLKTRFQEGYGLTTFTRDEFMDAYVDHTGCGMGWADRDFKKYSRKNAKRRWIIEVN